MMQVKNHGENVCYLRITLSLSGVGTRDVPCDPGLLLLVGPSRSDTRLLALVGRLPLLKEIIQYMCYNM